MIIVYSVSTGVIQVGIMYNNIISISFELCEVNNSI